MENRNRNLLIGIAVLIVVLCCCAAVIVAAVWLSVRVDRGLTDVHFFEFNPDSQAQVEQSFAVGEKPYLDLGNFAGEVSVRAGEDNVIRVVAVKKASSESALDRISVTMREEGAGLVVRTTKQNNLNNAAVDLEVTAPPDTEMELHTGAGSIEIRGMTGSIDAHSGAGSITVSRAGGSVRLAVGAGTIRYQGTPVGRCSFESGAGEITIRLPANPDVRLDLKTGWGSISVGYDVDGSISPRDVSGDIGDGSQASIYANTGVGSISVMP